MPDYSTPDTADIPEAPPIALAAALTKDDATDRDSANPDEMAGAHARHIVANQVAQYLETIADAWGRVTAAGGLNVQVGAIRIRERDGTVVEVAKTATLAVADDDTSYVEVNAAGTVSDNTTGFTAGSIPLATVLTSGGDISTVTDKRAAFAALEALIDHGAQLTGLTDDDHTQYLLAAGTRDLTKLVFEASTELTIDTGAITVTQTVHRIDTEGDGASDDLVTINGGAAGLTIFIRAEHTDRSVVLKDGSGNIELAGADITLDDTDQIVPLYYDGTLSKWLLLANPPGSPPGNHTLDGAEHTDVSAITEAQGMFLHRGAATWDGFAVGTAGQLLATGGAAADAYWVDALLADGTVPLSADWDMGAYKITAEQLESDVAAGTPPLIVASGTVVPTLNVDKLDGYDASDFLRDITGESISDLADVASLTLAIGQLVQGDGSGLEGLLTGTAGQFLKSQGIGQPLIWSTPAGAGDLLADGTVPMTANWDMGNFEMRMLSLNLDVATGTAPMTIASTDVIANLNADQIDGKEATDLLLVDGTQAMTGDFQLGAFAIKMGEDTTPTPAAGFGFTYAQDDGGDTELYYLDAAGNEVQITEDGAVKATGSHGTTNAIKDHSDVAAAVSDSDAQGDVLIRTATNWDRLAASTAGYALLTAGAAADPAWGAVILPDGSVAMTLATLSGNLDMSGAASDVLLPDNEAAALEVKEGANAYMTFDSTNGSEALKLHKNSQFDLAAYFDAEVDNGNSGAADTIDWTTGNKQLSTLTDNCTFTFTPPGGPANLTLRLVQDGTGGRTVTWPAACHWPGGTPPTLSTGAGDVDLVVMYYNGTNYLGTSALDFS